MHRREFLKHLTITGGMVSASSTSLYSQLRVRNSMPNILLIMTDQQTASAMSCAGNPYLETPHLDRLAETGIRFDRAYCSQPLCIPSRACMFTGRWPHEVGVTYNKPHHSIHVPMMGTILGEAGYDTGYVGKWHLTIPPSRHDLHGFRTVRHARDNRLDEDVPDASTAFLRQRRDRPFLLVSSFVNPHDICEWARGEPGKEGPYLEPPNPDTCPPLPGNFAIPELEPSILRTVQPFTPGMYPSLDWHPEKWRQYRWAYYRLVETVDRQIGTVLQALDVEGLSDSTVVIFTSDHGDGAGAHRWNQKQVLYEEPVHIPLIIRAPDDGGRGLTDTRHLVSNGLDLIPTLCDYAGITSPEALTGASLRPLIQGKTGHPWRSHLVVETEFCPWDDTFGIMGRMIRNDRYKYVVYSHGGEREQLFDLQQDPGETENRIHQSDLQPVVERLRQTLREHCRDTQDGFPPERIGPGVFPYHRS